MSSGDGNVKLERAYEKKTKSWRVSVLSWKEPSEIAELLLMLESFAAVGKIFHQDLPFY